MRALALGVVAGALLGLGLHAGAESNFTNWFGPVLTHSTWEDHVQIFEDGFARCYITPPYHSDSSYAISCVKK